LFKSCCCCVKLHNLRYLSKMKAVPQVLVALNAAHAASAAATPIAKVLSMISELQAKVIGEGEVAQKEYAEFAEWCEDRSSNLGFEIKTGKADVNTLEGVISKETSTINALNTKVDELAAELAQDEADLKAATHIRAAEQGTFAASEADLMETIDMLGRAALIIEREMKGGASMLQLQGAQSIAQALGVLVHASLFSTSDASKLTALVQQKNEDGDVDAPAGDVYKSQSGDILATLQDLKEKADQQLDDARNKEKQDTNNFQMLRQSLEDQVSYGKKELDEAKAGISASSESKATAEGDLAVTSKELATDVKTKASLHHDCMKGAQTFEAETKSRGEELAALAKAKEVIREATGAALEQVSFLQEKLASGADLAILETVRLIRDIAGKQHSTALTQLATKMTAAMQGADQFKKVKGLIRDMLARLEAEQAADAAKKAWCDRNLADSRQRKSEKIAEIAKMTSRIDLMTANSAQLKEEIATLEAQLAKLAQSQAEMDRLRKEENTAYLQTRADQEKGLEGLKLALKVLTEYYGGDHEHEVAQGAGQGIIGLLEVCESDFTKDLARTIADEEAAVAEYEQMTDENEIDRTTKDQDVKYKMKESKRLDQDSAELTTDRSTVQMELDATSEALVKMEEQCSGFDSGVEKAESYASRRARHEAEIAGLKQALDILENETALLQQRSAHKLLRGASRRA